MSGLFNGPWAMLMIAAFPLSCQIKMQKRRILGTKLKRQVSPLSENQVSKHPHRRRKKRVKKVPMSKLRHRGRRLQMKRRRMV